MALVQDGELYALPANHGEELIDGKFQDADAGGSVASARVLNLAIQTMLEELAPNLWEDSLERLVDFGHGFSLELEMAALFDEKLFHGEAVAVDMAFCTVLAYITEVEHQWEGVFVYCLTVWSCDEHTRW